MSGKPRFTQEQMITALQQAKGLVTVTARLLHCSPSTVEVYIERYPAVAEARRQEREGIVDLAELALVKAIQNGEGWAISLTLKTLGKSRGYVERTENVTELQGRVVVEEHHPEHLSPEMINRVARGLLTG